MAPHSVLHPSPKFASQIVDPPSRGGWFQLHDLRVIQTEKSLRGHQGWNLRNCIWRNHA